MRYRWQRIRGSVRYSQQPRVIETDGFTLVSVLFSGYLRSSNPPQWNMCLFRLLRNDCTGSPCVYTHTTCLHAAFVLRCGTYTVVGREYVVQS
jgi:hypothetical protein